MKKVKIIYNPLEGICMPDGIVESFALDNINQSGTSIIRTCSEVLVLQFRVLLMEGHYDELEIIYESEQGLIDIPVNHDENVGDIGVIDLWPDGFCDVSYRLLTRLFL